MRELEFIKSVAIRAGEIALKHHGKEPEFWHKPNDQGRVSVADIEVDDFVCNEIAHNFPDDGILTEEREDDLARLDMSRVWIVDPIDGTEAYLNGEQFFTISIALVEDGLPIVGVVYAPKLGRLFYAEKGKGAFESEKPINASGESNLTLARVLASNARYNRPMIEPEPSLNRSFRPSIALRLALIATGEYDGTFALRPSWEWDLAAGALIVEEAGAVLCDREGNAPKFNQEIPQVNGMIAGAPDLVQKLVKRIS